MTRAHLFLPTALLLASGVLSAAAQSFLPKTIQFKGDSEHSDAELIAAAQLKKGVAMSIAEMNDHTKLLVDSGIYQDVSFTFNGQDLVVKLIPVTTLYPIRLENFPFATDKDLDQRLHDRLPLYHGTVPTSGSLLDGVSKELEDQLSAKSIKATVIATPYTDLKLSKVTAMSFAITDPEVEVGTIQLTGVADSQAPKARQAVSKVSGTSYSIDGSPSQIETALLNLYGAQGYLEAKVKAIAQPAVLEPSDIRIPFSVPVEEGPQYKLAGVQLTSDLIVTQANLDKLPGLHLGDIASSTRLRAIWDLIERQYHNKGYMKARVQPTPAFDRSKGTVSYSVAVDAGPQYTMGKLKIINASDDLRETILSLWKLPNGEVFNESELRGFAVSHGANQALERLIATVNLSYSLKFHDDSHTVDVDLTLERKHE